MMEPIYSDSTTNSLDSKIFTLHVRNHHIDPLLGTEKRLALANEVLTEKFLKTTLYRSENSDLITETFRQRNVLFGNEDNDRLTGSNQNDVLNGGAGQDVLTGGSGADRLVGGTGNDYLLGGNRNDQLKGQSGNDRLWGEAGNDYLDGGVGIDSLHGNRGNDRLIDQDGGDRLTGGQGMDRFEVGSPLSTMASLITDFNVGIDQVKILRLGATFSSLSFSDRKTGAIVFDQGKAIAVLLGVKVASLNPDSFIFGSATLADDLQEIIQRSLQGTQIPGASAAVVTPDGTTWVGTEGVSNLSTGKAVSVNDRFNIGSTTKAIVATTVLQLVEEGKLNLSDTLNEYIPKVADQLPNGDRITIRELLNHTSGLPDVDNIIREQTLNSSVFRAKIINDLQVPQSVRRLFRSLKTQPITFESLVSNPIILQLNSTDFNYLAKALTANSSFARKRVTPKELIALAYNQQPLAKPGQEYQYKSINYLLLGEIVEAVTGSTLAREMRKRIFEPLGMSNTVYPPQEKRSGHVARGYEDFNGDGKADDVLKYLDPSQFGFANGGIYSTAVDLARFAQGLFKGELLAPATLKAMLSRGNQDDETFKYGLGILYGNVPGIGKVWQHGGDNDGWHARMFYLPDHDITAVVVENGDDVAQRRNSGNPAAPTLLIDDLIYQLVQRVES